MRIQNSFSDYCLSKFPKCWRCSVIPFCSTKFISQRTTIVFSVWIIKIMTKFLNSFISIFFYNIFAKQLVKMLVISLKKDTSTTNSNFLSQNLNLECNSFQMRWKSNQDVTTTFPQNLGKKYSCSELKQVLNECCTYFKFIYVCR